MNLQIGLTSRCPRKTWDCKKKLEGGKALRELIKCFHNEATFPNLDLRFGLELELAMNTLADYKLIKLGSDLKPQFIIRVRNSCGFRQVSTFEPTLEQETVGLDLLGNWIFVLFELVFVLFLLREVVLVALDVVVVDDSAELLAHGLYLGLPPRGVVEHLDLVRQLQT